MSWLSAAANVAGGLLDFKASKDAQKISKQQFRQQMDESIQRRVADAKAAGVHPLFALGASVGASPTSTVVGSGLGDAVRGAADAMTRGYQRKEQAAKDEIIDARLERVAQAEISAKMAQANRDEAEAALINSNRKRLEQGLGSRGHDGGEVKTFPFGTNPGPEVVYGPAEFFNPEVPTSKVPGVQSGTTPATQDYIFPDGRKIRTYGESLQADELKQVDIVYRRAIHKGTDAFMAVERFLKSRGIPYKWMRGRRWMR